MSHVLKAGFYPVGGGEASPPNVSAPPPPPPPQKRFCEFIIFFLIAPTLFPICYCQNSKVHFHMKCVYYISPCTLSKIFVLRVGPSHTYLKLPPQRNFLDRALQRPKHSDHLDFTNWPLTLIMANCCCSTTSSQCNLCDNDTSIAGRAPHCAWVATCRPVFSPHQGEYMQHMLLIASTIIMQQLGN